MKSVDAYLMSAIPDPPANAEYLNDVQAALDAFLPVVATLSIIYLIIRLTYLISKALFLTTVVLLALIILIGLSWS